MDYRIIGEGVSAKAAKRLIEAKGGRVVEEGGSVCVLSPGYPQNDPRVIKARQEGLEVIGEMELGMRYVQNRCLAITGTNGKTTATLLLTHVLNQTGEKARAVGNVGFALCDYLVDPDPTETLVVEVSSFQIETMRTPAFAAGGITNITPDHLDRYASFEEYAEMKRHLRHFVKGSFYEGGNLPLLLSGLSEEDFKEAAKDFVRPSHRIEFVKTVDGISYYNDSKGTNVDAAVYAVNTLESPIVIIVGGRDKGGSYAPWNQAFTSRVKHVLAIGEAADKIKHELTHPVEIVGTLDKALLRAKEVAKAGDAVLLSPGCSSFDQFTNYIDRGDTFKRLVEEMK